MASALSIVLRFRPSALNGLLPPKSRMKLLLFLTAVGFMVLSFLETKKAEKRGVALEAIKLELAAATEQFAESEERTSASQKTMNNKIKELDTLAKALEAKANAAERQLQDARAELEEKQRITT